MTEPKVYILAFSDEYEQIVQLHTYLKQKGAKLSPLKDKLNDSDRFNTLMEMVKESKVLYTSNEDEKEEVLNSILSILITFQPTEAEKIVRAWSEVALSKDVKGTGWQSLAGHTVNLFSNLFNFYDSHPSIKFQAFKVLVEVAGRARLTKSLELDHATIQSYVSEWNLTIDQHRELLRILHKALIADHRTSQAAEVMTRLLGTYSLADAAKAEEDACACVRTAIIDPETFSFDSLLRIHAVQHLQKSHPDLYKLLNILNQGTMSDFKAFDKDKGKFYDSFLNTSSAPLLKKMKILSLITLAEENKVLSYEKLQKELGFDAEDDLEKFLIEVIQSNVITGKLNGVRKEFHVTAFTQRTFGQKEWHQLRNKLQNLIENLKHTKKNVEIAQNPELGDLQYM